MSDGEVNAYLFPKRIPMSRMSISGLILECFAELRSKVLWKAGGHGSNGRLVSRESVIEVLYTHRFKTTGNSHISQSERFLP